MVLFRRSMTLFLGPAYFDNKSLLMSNKYAVYRLKGEFLTFREIISTERLPVSPTRELKVASLLVQLYEGK